MKAANIQTWLLLQAVSSGTMGRLELFRTLTSKTVNPSIFPVKNIQSVGDENGAIVLSVLQLDTLASAMFQVKSQLPPPQVPGVH